MALPAASKRLRQLESALGVRLLQRTTRRQSLTEEGALLHARAVQILADLDQVESQLSKRSGTVTGRLRVTAPWRWGAAALPPCWPTSGACIRN
ncbi:LysR family transcriptional regulator [Azotobacter sp. CWF10]